MPLFDPESGKISISNHSLGYIVDCDTRAVLYSLGYRDQPFMEAPAKCGIGLHDGFAEYFCSENKQAAIGKFTSSYRKWSDTNVAQGSPYEYDNAVRIFSFWMDKNPLSKFPFTVIPELVEKGFEIPLLSDGSITFNGRPDAVVADRKHPENIYIVDHKTVGYMKDEWLRGFEMDAQMSGYCYMAEQYGLNVKGVYINAIEIKKLSDATTACPQHHVPRIDCALKHVGYKVVPYKYNPELIDEWYKTAVSEAVKLRGLLDKMGVDKAGGIVYNLSHINRIRQQGRFRKNQCTNCGFFEFCKQGRTMQAADNFLIKAKEHK